MARLKRWESPRREGRNDKGKKSSARQRQLKKQTQMLRKRLKQDDTNNQQNNQKRGSGTQTTSLFFWLTISTTIQNLEYSKQYFVANSSNRKDS
jgi:hypothetical protein